MPDEQIIRPAGITSAESFGTPTVLLRELYSVGEAARLLRLPSRTLRRWLEGYQSQPPILPAEDIPSGVVAWGQFVEAGLLREYRNRDVPLQRLRPILDRLRETYSVAFPLAHFRPWVDTSARHLVFETQKTIGLDEELFLVRPSTKPEKGIDWQLIWAAPVQEFLEKVEFQDDIARRMRPMGKDTPVVIDPEVNFGVPHIRGYRTETLAEAFASGETEEEIATEWGLTVDEVKAAIRWELKTAA